MEDKLEYLYKNSEVILNLIKEGKINPNDVKRMIFYNDNCLKEILEDHNNDLDCSSHDKYMNSKELLNILLEQTYSKKRKEILCDIESLFGSQCLAENGAISMNTKELLIDKFIYFFNNIEVISDLIETSNNNYNDNKFRNSNLEALLLEYNFPDKDNGRKQIETYRKLLDNISSYDLIHKTILSEKTLNNLVKYIRMQGNDDDNKKKKLKVLDNYYQLLWYIKNEEIIKNTYIELMNEKDKIFKVFNSKYTLTISNYILKQIKLSRANYKISSSIDYPTILRDTNDTGVENNCFINNNTLITISEEDKKKVLDTVRKQKKFVKKIIINYK